MTFRVTSVARLEILRAVVHQTDSDLGSSGIAAHVIDASEGDYRDEVESLLSGRALGWSRRNADLPMPSALYELLDGISTPHFALHLDDMLTIGQSPNYLSACCDFLDRYGDVAPIVRAPRLLGVQLDHARATVRVEFDQAPSDNNADARYYRVHPKYPQRPVRLIRIGSFIFGVFENRAYGFIINQMVGRTADYKRRLAWYMRNVSMADPHRIEVAASHRTLGPAWTHVGICLNGGIGMAELDYSASGASARERQGYSRDLVQALQRGYAIEVVPGRGLPDAT